MGWTEKTLKGYYIRYERTKGHISLHGQLGAVQAARQALDAAKPANINIYWETGTTGYYGTLERVRLA